MRVIKKINNNVAICLDNNKRELIAFGKGIGFPEMPYELSNLSKITRTFYGIDEQYIGLLNEIEGVVFQICIEIVDEAKNRLNTVLNSNLVFTLADHVNFAIERTKKGIKINLPLYYELEHLYEKEVELGRFSLEKIKNRISVYLPQEEVYSIALHLINAEEQPSISLENDCEKVFEGVTEIIENSYGLKIQRKNFNYSRFLSHIQYLLKRKDEKTNIQSENLALFSKMKEDFPKCYACVNVIKVYFEKELNWHLSDEESLYLMLHINRLCSREDCNQ